MSARRTAASERRQLIEAGEVHTEMRDDADEASSDYRRDMGREDLDEAEGDGRRDMLQLIHTISTFLCSVREK